VRPRTGQRRLVKQRRCPGDDGLFCTTEDVCQAGSCSGAARTCEDGVVCNGVSACLEDAGACSADENQCDDVQLCSVATDQCVSTCDGCVVDGVCLASGAAAANNACLVCDPARSATSLSVTDGAPCGSAAAECSGQDTCNAVGQCVPNHLAAGTTCGALGAQCDAVDTCDGSGLCVRRVAQEGSPCEDGQFCTQADRCQAGQCVAGGARNCGASQSCDEVADQCRCNGCLVAGTCFALGTTNPANACQVCNPLQNATGFVNNGGAPCDDGQFCTEGDSCQAGQCAPGGARNCGANTTCDEASNACVTNLAELGDSCSSSDGCAAGRQCTFSFVDSDGDGFGSGSPIGVCGAGAPNVPLAPGAQFVVAGGDCCDAGVNANLVFPGQLRFFSVASACGGFDYNCDGEETYTPPTDNCAGPASVRCEDRVDLLIGPISPATGCGRGGLPYTRCVSVDGVCEAVSFVPESLPAFCR
jgi:hypothetical protein